MILLKWFRWGFGSKAPTKDPNDGATDNVGPEAVSVWVASVDASGYVHPPCDTSGKTYVQILRPYGAPTKVALNGTTAVSLLPSGCDAVVLISVTEAAGAGVTCTLCADSGKTTTIGTTASLSSQSVTFGVQPVNVLNVLMGGAYAYLSGASAGAYVTVQGYKIQ